MQSKSEQEKPSAILVEILAAGTTARHRYWWQHWSKRDRGMAILADHYPHLLLSLDTIRLQSDALRWQKAHLYREAVTQNSPGSDLRAQRVEGHPEKSSPNRIRASQIAWPQDALSEPLKRIQPPRNGSDRTVVTPDMLARLRSFCTRYLGWRSTSLGLGELTLGYFGYPLRGKEVFHSGNPSRLPTLSQLFELTPPLLWLQLKGPKVRHNVSSGHHTLDDGTE
jgi:hypothetical protein